MAREEGYAPSAHEESLVGTVEHGFDRAHLLKSAAGLVAASGLGSLLAACGGKKTQAGAGGAEPKRGGTIKIALGDASSGDSLDPGKLLTSLDATVHGMVYDNLIRLDQSFRPHPALAETWETSRDARVWTFRLRKGVEYHDGRTLHADDVAYMMRRNLDPRSGSGGLQVFSPYLAPSGIDLVDPRTIRFRLKAPNAFFVQALGGFYGRVYPAGTTRFAHAVGTGPFKAVSFEPGVGFEVARNPNYWESGLPYLDGIRGVVIFEPSTKAQGLLTGDLDAIDFPEYSTLPQLQSSSNVHLYRARGGAQLTIALDATSPHYHDVRVRRAMKMLLDREKFYSVVFHDQGDISADVPIPPNDAFYPHDVQPLPHDPEQARSLLRQAGLGDGFSETVYTTNVDPGMVNAAVVAKSMWADGRVQASVSQRNADDFYTHIWLQKPAVVGYFLRQHVSTVMQFVFASRGPWNESHWHSAGTDKLILEAQSTTDEARQKELWGEALREINEQSGEISMHVHRLYPTKKRLRGLELNWTDIAQFRRAYLA